jgi:hypothetical protein
VLSEEEIDDLLQSRTLYINGEIRWKQKSNQQYFEFRLKVSGCDHDIELVCTKNPLLEKGYSFALLLEGKRIRGFDPDGRHLNRFPKREQIVGIHKHKWTDDYEDSNAYVPNDIPSTEISAAFYAFLNECNIRFDGTFVPPPVFQPGLF